MTDELTTVMFLHKKLEEAAARALFFEIVDGPTMVEQGFYDMDKNPTGYFVHYASVDTNSGDVMIGRGHGMSISDAVHNAAADAAAPYPDNRMVDHLGASVHTGTQKQPAYAKEQYGTTILQAVYYGSR